MMTGRTVVAVWAGLLLGSCAGQVAPPAATAPETPTAESADEPDAAAAATPPETGPAPCERLIAELETRERPTAPRGRSSAGAASQPPAGLPVGRGIRPRWCYLSPDAETFCEAGSDDVAALLEVVDACYPEATVSRPTREGFVAVCRERGPGPNVLFVGEHFDVFFRNVGSHIMERPGEPCQNFCDRIFAWNLMERATGRTLWRPRYTITRDECLTGCQALDAELQTCLVTGFGDADCAAVESTHAEARGAFTSSLGYQHLPDPPLIDCSY